MANTNEMVVTFPGGKKVDAEFMGTTIKTDQSIKSGGEGSAPEPFMLFLASLATCAGWYVMGFCNSRNIPTDGVRLIERIEADEKGKIEKIALEIQVPPEFPTKYHKAIVKAAGNCAVKKVIMDPPEITVDSIVTE